MQQPALGLRVLLVTRILVVLLEPAGDLDGCHQVLVRIQFRDLMGSRRQAYSDLHPVLQALEFHQQRADEVDFPGLLEEPADIRVHAPDLIQDQHESGYEHDYRRQECQPEQAA